MAKLLQDTGAILVGISDSKTALYNDNGLNIGEILHWK